MEFFGMSIPAPAFWAIIVILIVVVVLVIAINFIGDALRDALDPNSRN